MFDSIHHMTLKLLSKHIFWHENAKILPYIHKVVMTDITQFY